MADVSVTAASVKKTTTEPATRSSRGIAGATITAGQVLCKNPTGGKLELADANGASSYMKVVVGIALHGASADQPLEYATSGNITFNAALTAGTNYVLSATPGAFCPTSDLASGHTVVYIGAATSTTNLNTIFFNSGAVV